MSTEVALYIDQGISYSSEIAITDNSGYPIDLTNALITSQIRRSYTSSVAYPFTITVVNAVQGIVRLELSREQTLAIPTGRFVYDSLYSIGHKTVRFMKGTVTVRPSATKEAHVTPTFTPAPTYTPLDTTTGNELVIHQRFIYTQNVPQDTWVIDHNLNLFPSVTVVDTAGTVVIGNVKYNSSMRITVTFNGAFSGIAYLN